MNVARKSYETLNRFVVELAKRDDDSLDDDSLFLVFERHGLFSWKLARMRIPLPSPSSSPAAARAPNKPAGWQLTTATSPIDDSKTFILSRAADTPVGSGFMRSTPTLIIRHKERVLEVYINFGMYLGSDSTIVTTRMGSSPAKSAEWGLSTDGKAIFCPTPSHRFVKSLLANDRLVVRLTPFGESPVTSTFELRGLASTIRPMRHLIR
jgi:type VI secretion system protein VasI